MLKLRQIFSPVRKLVHPNNFGYSPLIMAQKGAVTSGFTSQKNVLHDPSHNQFYIPLDANAKAVLDYHYENGNIINMTHTEVPPKFREHGYAGMLAQAAFDFAVENHYKMKLTCSYLQKYYNDHPYPQYKELLVEE